MLDQQTMRMPGWRGGDGDAAYLDKTLRYEPMELSLDESVHWRVVFQLWFRASLASIVVFIPFIVLWFIATIGSLASGNGIDSGVDSVLVLGYLASFVVFWFVLLLQRLPEPIAEWRVLLTDRADRADSVYNQIAGTLRDRQMPIKPEYQRIRTDNGSQQVRNTLVLTEGSYRAYVSVFGYGTSAYLGWMMWRTRRGEALIKQFFADLFNGIRGRNDPELLMLRTERPRAMREALHAACREGLFVAVEGHLIPDSYGFPDGLPPIRDSGAPAAPAPRSPRHSPAQPSPFSPSQEPTAGDTPPATA